MNLCLTIVGPSRGEVEEQLRQVEKLGAIAEIRVDCLEKLPIESLRELISASSAQVMLTLRSQRQGGRFAGGVEEQTARLAEFAAWHPAYLDIELNLGRERITSLMAMTKAQCVISEHIFEGEKVDISTLWKELETYPKAYWKVAMAVERSVDALGLLLRARERAPQAIGVTMGSLGYLGRILAPLMGFPFTFAALSQATIVAPGQPTAQELIEEYHYPRLNKDSSWYCLLGYPIGQSLSPRVHNAFYRASGVNAVYVRVPTKEEELEQVLTLLKQLGCKGCSVTMPLKEAIIPLLPGLDPRAELYGAANTLDKNFYGYNTDGAGALDALQAAKGEVSGCRLLLLGAGGAARAIAFEAVGRGAAVTIANRTYERAQSLAAACGAAALPLTVEAIQQLCRQDYDIVVNTIPSPPEWIAEQLLPQRWVMDIANKPSLTPFLQAAQRRGCHVIFGREMFIRQAVGQAAVWFPNIDSKIAYNTIAGAAQES